MKMRILVLFLLLIALVNKLQMQELPDCMCMPYSYPPHNPEYYLDSAFLIDTCDIQYKSQDCDSSMWLNCFYTADFRERIYAKEKWVVEFDVKAFDIPYYDPDTIIYVSWRDVDSINYPEIKDSLKKIENDFGNYIMRKLHPDIIQPGIGQSYVVTFNNYVNGVEIENKFRAIPYTYCDFKSGIIYIESIEENAHIDSHINVSPNPASEYIEINVETQHAVTLHNDQIRIFNVYAEQMTVVVQNYEPLLIDVSGFPDGMYFLKLSESSKLSESYRIYKFVVIK